VALERLGDFRMALDDFTEANRLAPSPMLIACKGYCLSRLNQHGIAVALYRKALDFGYRSPGLLNNIGYSLRELGRLDESEKCLKQALEDDEDLPAAHHNLVVVFTNRAFQGRPVPPEAFGHVRRAVELGPPSADLYRDVATLCAVAAQGDAARIPSAIEYLEKGLLYGLDPQAMGKDPAFAALGGNPAFERLQTQKAASSPATKAAYLVDPL
jgi:Flp pilus assembly protein TadD